MSEPQQKPEKLEVGQVCHVEGRHCGDLCYAYTTAIARFTKRRAYMGGECWFALDDPERIVHPRYVNYTTRVVRIEPKGAEQ